MKKVISQLLILVMLMLTIANPISAATAIQGETYLAGFNLSIISSTTVTGSAVTSKSAVATSTATAAPKKTIKKVYKYDKKYTKCSLNLRKKPNAKSKIKKVLPIGTKIKRIYVREDGWTKVKYKKKKGYVKNKYLTKKQPQVIKKSDTTLKGIRKSNADRIARVCIKNYKKYGVLPSVCVAQAFIETGIGTAYNNGNLWGLSSNNFGGYSSIETGCIAYLKCINNGWYKGAPFAGSYTKQITKILYGGYCDKPASYIAKAIWVIQHYNLTDYDKYL